MKMKVGPCSIAAITTFIFAFIFGALLGQLFFGASVIADK